MTTPMTIAHQVTEMHAARAAAPANPAMAAFATEQAGLANAGPPSTVAAVGSVVPDVALLDAHGAATSLYAAVGDGLCVVVLYRGAWCPYCNITLATYQAQLLPHLTERGVVMAAISPQSPDGSLSMQEKHDLRFSVLSDPGNMLANALGVITAPTADVRQAQLGRGLDLSAVNADGTIALPMPTVAVIDSAHLLRWIDVHPDYTTRTEPGEILTALRDLD